MNKILEMQENDQISRQINFSSQDICIAKQFAAVFQPHQRYQWKNDIFVKLAVYLTRK